MIAELSSQKIWFEFATKVLAVLKYIINNE